MKANGGKWPSRAGGRRDAGMEFKAFGGTVKMREDGQGLEDQLLGVDEEISPSIPFQVWTR